MSALSLAAPRVDERMFVAATKGVFAMDWNAAVDNVEIVAEQVERAWEYLSFETRRQIRRAIEDNGPGLYRWARCVEVCDSYLMDDEIEVGVFWWR